MNKVSHMENDHNWQYASTLPQFKTLKREKRHWWSNVPWNDFKFTHNVLRFVCDCGDTKWVIEQIIVDERQHDDN